MTEIVLWGLVMAIIIKADIPKHCYECYIQKNWTFDFICPLMEKDADLNTWMRADCRHPDCPIIGEIPDEHGRLVSLDKLKESLNQKIFVEGSITVRDITDLLDNAPTVVEATT